MEQLFSKLASTLGDRDAGRAQPTLRRTLQCSLRPAVGTVCAVRRWVHPSVPQFTAGNITLRFLN